jgi:hypothetical protein
MPSTPTRRQVLDTMLRAGSALALCGSTRAEPPMYRLATFTAEVTVPLGHALMGGGIAPAARIEDPLFVHGFVLLGAGKPLVYAAVDWCEIRNDAYDRWRTVLAEAAGTTPDRVLVSALHQHDAPIADLTAQELLEKNRTGASVCDRDFHEKAVQRVGRAVRDGLKSPRRITHFGTGQAKAEKLASNRRYLTAEGRVTFGRTSASRDPRAHEAPEGLIDPWLKTLSFWDGDEPVLALSVYAIHPMSYYGKGGVSADFIGMARGRRQKDEKAFQIYASGCSGNVTAGKYNDGSPANRPVLAERLYQAMAAAWKDTKRQPLDAVRFRSVPLRLEPRNDPGFTLDDLQKRLETDKRPFGRCLAALGLSWRKQCAAGHKLDVPVIDLGKAQLLLLPAEAYVEFQLYAQQARPDSFVVTLGYGESAPGYIPTQKHIEEKDGNLADWCWVAPGAEQRLKQAIDAALKGER